MVPATAFYSEKQLDVVTSLSRATRWRLRQCGDFPKPVQLSPGRVGYPVYLIDAWISERLSDA
ncbi:MAG: AlpA family phage regulatory protein [Hyphomicrobiales bacterium]|nr:AlpA family phage regulatory protein [Hyphomicrobiales bacterium]